MSLVAPTSPGEHAVSIMAWKRRQAHDQVLTASIVVLEGTRRQPKEYDRDLEGCSKSIRSMACGLGGGVARPDTTAAAAASSPEPRLRARPWPRVDDPVFVQSNSS